MSRQSVLFKLDEAGKNNDDAVIQLKKRMEELGQTLLSMKAKTSNGNEIINKGAESNEVQPGIQFIDEQLLPFVCVVDNVTRNDSYIPTTEISPPLPSSINVQQAETKKEILRCSYQVIGDNLDFFVKVKHMSNENQNRSIHWFNLMGVPLRITGSDLDNTKSLKPVSQLRNTDFIPSANLSKALINDMIPLVARIIVTHMPAFSEFRKCIPWHIEHKYSTKMEKATAEIPLGLVMKNESIGAEMIEIMELVQERYVPCIKEGDGANETTQIVQTLYFGGDNLTEERARNLQGAMSDGETAYDRLKGIIPKNEDWHAIRYMYKILYEAFFDEGSAKDVGTMCYNMNIAGVSNAREPLQKFNEAKEFTNLETDALIVALTMRHFEMKDLDEDANEKIPGFLQEASCFQKRQWLFQQIDEILKLYVLHSQAESLDKVTRDISNLDEQQPPFKCSAPGCSKEYRYKKACMSHETKVHAIAHLEQVSTSRPSASNDSNKDKDDVFDYACSRINLGLLLRNADDAVAEGDGERIIRCWRFFLLYYRAFGHHKYAFAAFQLISKITATLSPAMAEQLIWNRTVNRKGGKGHNIACDLRLEQLNCLTKEMLYNLGVNLDEKTAARESNAIGYIEKLLEATDKDLSIKAPSGRHKKRDKKGDMLLLVMNLCTKNVFTKTPGRSHQHYQNFDRNLLSKLEVQSLNKWLKDHMRKLKDDL